MNFVHTEEQALLAETARRFADEHVPLERFRARRALGPHAPELWKRIADMGWLALVLPEEHDGLGLGLAEYAIVAEALGRNLCTEPLWTTALLAGRAIAAAGGAQQRAAWLPAIAAGRLVATLALQEPGGRYDLFRVRTSARETEDGFVLDGTKAHVLDAGVAGLVLVVARTSGAPDQRDGLSLFAVPTDAPGLSIVRERRVDERDAATVTLTGVRVGHDALLGAPGQAAATLDAVLDPALVGLAAEMLGAAEHAMEITLEYMRGRVQFDVPIASFQALQHRMAHVFERVEMARSAVMAAARAWDAGSGDAAAFASMAKAKASQALELAAKEGIQIHGGVGMTDEYDIGLFLKRHRGAETTLGDRAWHLRRWAELSGY